MGDTEKWGWTDRDQETQKGRVVKGRAKKRQKSEEYPAERQRHREEETKRLGDPEAEIVQAQRSEEQWRAGGRGDRETETQRE